MLGKAVFASNYAGYPAVGPQIPVVGIGTNGAMYLKFWDGSKWLPSQNDWLSLGGGFGSAPTAWQCLWNVLDSYETGFIGLGLDYQAYEMMLDLVSWPPISTQQIAGGVQAWEALGGTFNSALDAKPWGWNQVDATHNHSLAIVGLGTDNQPYLYATSPTDLNDDDPKSSQGWLALGNKFIYDPVISAPNVSNVGNNTFDVFGIGTDRQLYHMVINGNQSPIVPSTWQPSGGCFISAPAVFGSGSRIDVFGLGTDNQMYHRAWNNGSWLSDWEALGGSFQSPAAVTGGVNPLDVFGIQSDGQMYHKWWNGAQWMPSQTGWVPLGGQFICAPTAVTPLSKRIDVFGLGTDNQMYHKAWTGGPDWVPTKLDWELLGGTFTIPRQTLMPAEITLSAQITFSGGTPVGGTVQVVLFQDGTSSFTGHMHDSGFPDYNYIVVCRVIDTQNNAYQFTYSGSVSGTVSLGQSRDSSWSLSGVAVPAIAANWDNFFPCGGLQLNWWAQTNIDLTTLLASIGTGGLTSVLNVTFTG